MGKKELLDNLSESELAHLLYYKRRTRRQERLRRLKADGRVVDIPGILPPDDAPPVITPVLLPQNQTSEAEADPAPAGGIRWRWVVNKFFLFVEITAVLSFIIIGITLWNTNNELNQELGQVQRLQSQALALPTPTQEPLIDVVILPGGHKPPVPGQSPQPGEAGDIPANLLPVINAYVPPPKPTPAPIQARRIQIPAIDIDAPVVQGMYDWEALKRGVAQKIGSAAPGQVGNMALAAHNDIYGELFRDLDQLRPGDEVIVSTSTQSYTYVVRETRIVEPTEVSVLDPTDWASATLISCYPYRVNTQRIVVFADLADS
ncbi:MAG: class D sortase [Chloroflexi bacterium]|nr:class D sortase [Chloroflexota bacterium]